MRYTFFESGTCIFKFEVSSHIATIERLVYSVNIACQNDWTEDKSVILRIMSPTGSSNILYEFVDTILLSQITKDANQHFYGVHHDVTDLILRLYEKSFDIQITVIDNDGVSMTISGFFDYL